VQESISTCAILKTCSVYVSVSYWFTHAKITSNPAKKSNSKAVDEF